MKIDAKHLAALEVIREEGSLTRAAAVLATSQPALSRLVSEFEHRLASPLFDRSVQPWRLTKLGEALALQGRAVLRAQNRATSELVDFRTGRSGTIHLAGPPYFSDSVIVSLLPRFCEKNPGVSFQISYGYAAELRDAVMSGRSDLALYPLPEGDTPGDLEFSRMFDAQNVIACRAGHPILELAYPRPLALLDYGWIVPPEGSPLAQDMRTVLSYLDMDAAEIVFAGASLAGVLRFLQQSDCLAVLPELTVASLGKPYGIQRVPIDTQTPRRTLGVLSRPRNELDLKTKGCLDFLLESHDWISIGCGEPESSGLNMS